MGINKAFISLALNDWKYYCFFTVLVFSITAYNSPNLNQKINLERETDVLEYQSEAINLLKYKKFPYVGFENSINDYSLDTTGKLSLSANTYLQVVKENRPVLNVSKPPLFPLFLAAVYKLFGCETSAIRLVQIFIISFISVFSLFLSIRLLGTSGVLVGILSGVMYFWNKYPETYDVYPNILLNLVVFLTLLFSSIFTLPHSKKTSFIIGVLLASMLLIKGHVIFIPFFYLLYSLYRFLITDKSTNFLYSTLGFFFVILPWVIFSNLMMTITKSEREIWRKKIKAGISNVMVEHTPFIKPYTSLDTIVMANNIKKNYLLYAEDGVVLLLKEANWSMGEGVIFGHNELCVDGWVHEESRFVKSLYANKFHLDKPAIIRVLYFYKDKPEYIYKLPVAKLLCITANEYKYFMFSIVCLGLLATPRFRNRLIKFLIFIIIIGLYWLLPKQLSINLVLTMAFIYNLRLLYLIKEIRIPPVLLFTITNNFLIIIMTFGTNRFANAIDSVTIFSAFFLGQVLIEQIFSKKLLSDSDGKIINVSYNGQIKH